MAALALGAMVGGCTNKATAPPPAKKLTIGVAIADTTNSFLSVMTKALVAEADRRGMETVVLNGYFNNETQARNAEKLVTMGVDLMILCSSRPSLVLTAIDRANEANIPVIALNAELDPGAKIVNYVGASNHEFGKGLGTLLAKALPKGGKAAVIPGPPGSTTFSRMAGIREALRERTDITLVDAPTDIFDSRENQKVTQQLLDRYPAGTLDAVVAMGPQMYAGAEYARSVGRADLEFIAGDYSTQVEAAIKSGVLFGTVNQSPVLEGRLAAEYAYYWLTDQKSEVPQPNKYIELPLITKANVDSSPAEWTG